MTEEHKKYHIPTWKIVGLVGISIIIIIVAGYTGFTFKDLYSNIKEFNSSKNMQFLFILSLLLLSLFHAIVKSMKRNLKFEEKKSIFDLMVWLTSTFTAFGICIAVYSCLSVIEGVLGQLTEDVQFLLAKNGHIILWQFGGIAFIGIIFCCIQIGVIVDEIISLIKDLKS